MEESNHAIKQLQEERLSRCTSARVFAYEDWLRLLEDLVGELVPDVVIELLSSEVDAIVVEVISHILGESVERIKMELVSRHKLRRVSGACGVLEDIAGNVPQFVCEVLVALHLALVEA